MCTPGVGLACGSVFSYTLPSSRVVSLTVLNVLQRVVLARWSRTVSASASGQRPLLPALQVVPGVYCVQRGNSAYVSRRAFQFSRGRKATMLSHLWT